MLPLGKGKVKENICLILFGFSDSTSRLKSGRVSLYLNIAKNKSAGKSQRVRG